MLNHKNVERATRKGEIFTGPQVALLETENCTRTPPIPQLETAVLWSNLMNVPFEHTSPHLPARLTRHRRVEDGQSIVEITTPTTCWRRGLAVATAGSPKRLARDDSNGRGYSLRECYLCVTFLRVPRSLNRSILLILLVSRPGIEPGTY